MVAELLPYFESARTFGSVALLLGLEAHPALLCCPNRMTALRVVLAQVIYQCDMEARFATMKSSIKKHKSRRQKLFNAEKKLIAAANDKVKPSELAIFQVAMLDHVRQRCSGCDTGVTQKYSMPTDSFDNIQTLATKLREPATKRRRCTGEADDILPDTCEGDPKRATMLSLLWMSFQGIASSCVCQSGLLAASATTALLSRNLSACIFRRAIGQMWNAGLQVSTAMPAALQRALCGSCQEFATQTCCAIACLLGSAPLCITLGLARLLAAAWRLVT